MTRRRILLISLAVVAALAAAWSGLWFWAAATLDQAVARWVEQERERGTAISYQGPEIAGFPVRLVASFDEPEVVTGEGWRWQGPRVVGHAAVWAPLDLRAGSSGDHHLLFGDELMADATLRNGTALVSLTRRGDIESATVELTGLAIDGPLIGRSTADYLRARVAPRPGAGPPALSLSAAATNLVLPERVEGALGRTIAHAAGEATLAPPLPPGKPRDALALWRDAGGTLDVHHLDLSWGPLTLDGDGTLSLDDQLRPLGAFTARITGLVKTLDALARAGVIKPGQALAVKVAFMALGGGNNQDGEPDVALPITLQEGFLFLGPIPLLPLSPVL